MALHVGSKDSTETKTAKSPIISNPSAQLEKQFIEDFKPYVPSELQTSAFNKKDGKFTNYSTQACFLTYVKLYQRMSKGQ